MYVSVIVPIYKIEPYLRECLDSILAQSFTDFELILVDDGSTDACPAICDEYAMKDPRITVIHKKNGGTVSARQAGIQAAQGDYIVYVDGDDAIFPEMFMEAYNITLKYQPDIISFSHCTDKNGEIRPVLEPAAEGLYQGESLEQEVYPRILMDENMEHLSYPAWGKVIKRSLLLPHQLAVDKKLFLGEDVACMIPAYLDASTIYISRKVMYRYRIRPLSDSRNFRMEQYEQLIRGVKALDSIHPERAPDFEQQLHRYVIFLCFGLLLSAIDFHGYDKTDQIRHYMRNEILQRHIRQAKFSNITLKTRITFFLLKRNAVRTGYVFLCLCRWIKGKRQV